jgi:hypothetical protein
MRCAATFSSPFVAAARFSVIGQPGAAAAGILLSIYARILRSGARGREQEIGCEAQEGAHALVLGRAHKYARRLSRYSKKDEPLAMGKEAHAPLLFIAHFKIGNSFGKLENLPQVV